MSTPARDLIRTNHSLWRMISAVSVRTKILGIALFLVMLLGAVAIGVVRASVRSVMNQEFRVTTQSLAENLATLSTDTILVNNHYQLYQLLVETKTSYPDIRYIFVVDSTGRVLAHTFGDGFPLSLLTANGVSPGGPTNLAELKTTEGSIWDVAAPIFQGRVGTIRMGFSDAIIKRTTEVVTLQLLLATLLVSTLGILSAIVLTRMITQPIQQLARAANAVGRGDLNWHVTRWADDEIGELADSFNVMVENLRLAADLSEERHRLQAELVERVINAQEAERKRIACDLHDQTSQALVSLIVQLKLVETAPNETMRLKNLSILREQLRDALGEVRQMALDLRPNVLDDLGLEQAIHWFGERCSQNNGIELKVVTNGNLDSLPERHTITIYRVVQEALSNVVKHSHAKHATIEINHHQDQIFIRVEDDGNGIILHENDVAGAHLGILGMQERTALLGGICTVQSKPGHGTAVLAEIPVPSYPATLLQEAAKAEVQL